MITVSKDVGLVLILRFLYGRGVLTAEASDVCRLGDSSTLANASATAWSDDMPTSSFLRSRLRLITFWNISKMGMHFSLICMRVMELTRWCRSHASALQFALPFVLDVSPSENEHGEHDVFLSAELLTTVIHPMR